LHAVESDAIPRTALARTPARRRGHGFRPERSLGCVYFLRSARVGTRSRQLRDPAPSRTRPRTRSAARLSRLLDRSASENGLQGALPATRTARPGRLARFIENRLPREGVSKSQRFSETRVTTQPLKPLR